MSTPMGLRELLPLMKEVFSLGKTVDLTIRGRSMSPFLKENTDKVVLGACPNPRELKRGDVPLYHRADGSVILHRIVKVKKDCFYMCGDAQSAIERDVPKENVDAVAVAFIRRGKYIKASSPLYRLYAMLWCGLLPIRKYIFKIVSLIKRR